MARLVTGIIVWAFAGCLFLTLGNAQGGGWRWSPLTIWSFTYSGMLLERLLHVLGLRNRVR